MLNAQDIPNSKVYTSRDCADDPQFRERGMVAEVEDPHFGMNVLHPGIVPQVPESPGAVRWPGPDIGEHTDEILVELLGLKPSEVAVLRVKGVV